MNHKCLQKIGKSSAQGHPSMEAMALNWCSHSKSSRPPDRNRYVPAYGARRVLASDKDSLHYQNLHPCGSQLSYFGHLAPAITLVEGAPRISAIWLCHTLGFSRMEVPKKWQLW